MTSVDGAPSVPSAGGCAFVRERREVERGFESALYVVATDVHLQMGQRKDGDVFGTNDDSCFDELAGFWVMLVESAFVEHVPRWLEIGLAFPLPQFFG